MRHVLHTLQIVLPFFSLILLGYLAARYKLVPLESISGLNRFVLYFALPCMLFRFGSRTPTAQLLDAVQGSVYLISGLAVVAFTVTISLNRRIRWNDAAFGALLAAFPNSGFMGVPLLVALLGPAAAGPTIATMLIDMLITTSLCIALSRLDLVPRARDGGRDHGGTPSSSRHPARQAASQALRGMLRNPMPWSIVLGMLAYQWQLTLPAPIDRTLALLADAASPVALFTIGAVLVRPRQNSGRARAMSSDWDDVIPVVLVKLVLHPALVAMIGSVAIQQGLPLSPFALQVTVLTAALPSASNVLLLADRFGANTLRVAQIILMSTALGFFTFLLVCQGAGIGGL